MRLLMSCLVCVTMVLLSCSARAQVTIDATGPTHGAWNNIKAGRSGGTGRKLPLQVTIAVNGTPFNASHGRTVLDFTLTNSGKQNIRIPVSPNADELNSVKSFRQLWLYVTSDTKYEKVLNGGGDPHSPFINLYGSDAVPSTLTTLAPGDSIRVRAEVALPQVSGADSGSTAFVAHAMMYDKTIKNIAGKPFMDSLEIGMATSPQYRLQTLLKQSH